MTLTHRSLLPIAVLTIAVGVVVAGSGFLATSSATTHKSGQRTAVNAATLNGYRANELLKTNGVHNPQSLNDFTTSSCKFKTVQTLKVTAPGKGYVMAWGSVGASRDTDFPNPEELVARLSMGKQASGENATQLTTDGSYDGNIAVQAVFPIQEGKHTVKLQLSACQPSAAAYVTNRAISTLFLPFGSSKVVPETVARSNG